MTSAANPSDSPTRAGKRALLLIAHGSRRQASNDEVRQLSVTLAGRLHHRFDSIDCAFLELAEPSIPEALQNCIDNGAGEIAVLPYFLAAGRHVVEDIPQIVAEKQARYPEITIRLLPYLGTAAGLIDLLAAMAEPEPPV